MCQNMPWADTCGYGRCLQGDCKHEMRGLSLRAKIPSSPSWVRWFAETKLCEPKHTTCLLSNMVCPWFTPALALPKRYQNCLSNCLLSQPQSSSPTSSPGSLTIPGSVGKRYPRSASVNKFFGIHCWHVLLDVFRVYVQRVFHWSCPWIPSQKYASNNSQTVFEQTVRSGRMNVEEKEGKQWRWRRKKKGAIVVEPSLWETCGINRAGHWMI